MYTIELFEAGRWFPCIIFTQSFDSALRFASERAAEIGEERVRILLDGKEI